MKKYVQLFEGFMGLSEKRKAFRDNPTDKEEFMESAPGYRNAIEAKIKDVTGLKVKEFKGGLDQAKNKLEEEIKSGDKPYALVGIIDKGDEAEVCFVLPYEKGNDESSDKMKKAAEKILSPYEDMPTEQGQPKAGMIIASVKSPK